MDGAHSPESFREPQGVYRGSRSSPSRNKFGEMLNAKKPPRKKAPISRQCHNDIYGLLDDCVIKGSVGVPKEWTQKARGEWGQRSTSLSPNLVRHQKKVSSAPTSPLTMHKRHGSATDLDDHLSFISDTDSNDPSRMSRRQAPRRHTVGGDDLENGERGDKNGDESVNKREAFLNMLAKRYPQYAERIHRPASESGYPAQNRRPRDLHRRATSVVTYNPGCEQDFDNRSDTMSSVDGSTFRRGGWMRNSMPVMRSPPNLYDKMSGVIFLVVGDQTRKAELPNEITHLDTVRALFVRSFPGKLTMEYLASPKQKIYILDTMTNIYYQLEELLDIKDRTVLRLYESDSKDLQRVRDPPPEVRGKQMQVSRESTPPRIPEQGRRSQTLPTGMTHSYPPHQENQFTQKAKTADRSRSLPRGQGPDYGYITYHSTDRVQSASPDRPNLRPIPEDRRYQNGISHNNEVRRSPPTNRSRSADPYYRELSPPSHAITAPGAPPQTYVAKGVRANTMVSPLRATGPAPASQDTRNLNRHTLAFTPMEETTNQGSMRSQSYRVPPDHSQHIPPRPRSVTPQPTPQDEFTQFRMDKMEEQIASLAAWVQTAVSSTSSRPSSVRSSSTTTPSEPPSSSTSSLSDISGVTQKSVTKNLTDGFLMVRKQASDLKGDLRQIRRLHQLSKESLQESIHETMKKIATALRSVPGAEHQLLRQHRLEADGSCQKYLEKKCRANKELSDLEGAVEELREDVISRQCRVNMSDVEGMALMLSTVTKTFGDLKAGFPDMQQDLKRVMAGEMEVVVNEERFLKEEPEVIEDALKRCKRLTGTLFTLKRLASVQQHRAPQVPTVGGRIPSDDEKRALLENIKAMVPDHQTRLMKLEAADASRQRKKKIITQQEALKFGKSLEIATRLLKPSSKESVSSASDGVSDIQSSSTATSVPAKSNTATSSATSIPVTKSNTAMSSASSSSGNLATKSPAVSSSESSAAKSSSSREVSENHSQEFVNREEDSHPQGAHLARKKDAARAAFFSSLTTPPTSPSPSEELESYSPPRPLMDYTVHILQTKDSSTGETQYTVTDGQYSQASHSSATAQLVSSTTTATSTGSSSASLDTRISLTNIPRISSVVKSTETVESSKISRKLRTSTPITSRDSEKAPSKIPSLRKDGHSESSGGPDVRPKKIPPPPPPRKSSRLPSPGIRMDTEVSQNGAVSLVPSKPELQPKDISILGGHQMQVKDSGIGTSTPKSNILPKPSSKFDKGIIEAIAVQNKESGTKPESHDPRLLAEEPQGARAKIPPPSKKPKPLPPQRKSSLSQSEERLQISKAKEKE